ncbi:MAG: hypothetical protein ACJ8NR_14125 [Sulfurifustis sp.]
MAAFSAWLNGTTNAPKLYATPKATANAQKPATTANHPRLESIPAAGTELMEAGRSRRRNSRRVERRARVAHYDAPALVGRAGERDDFPAFAVRFEQNRHGFPGETLAPVPRFPG